MPKLTRGAASPEAAAPDENIVHILLWRIGCNNDGNSSVERRSGYLIGPYDIRWSDWLSIGEGLSTVLGYGGKPGGGAACPRTFGIESQRVTHLLRWVARSARGN